MHINYLAILLATVVQFIIGALWYMPLFGKLWGKMHGFDKVPKAEQKEMMKSMGPYLVLQFLVTLVTTVILALFLTSVPSWNVYTTAGLLWLGFVLPTQVSAVVFGGTEGKWVVSKIAVMSGGALLCLEAAATILHMLA